MNPRALLIRPFVAVTVLLLTAACASTSNDSGSGGSAAPASPTSRAVTATTDLGGSQWILSSYLGASGATATAVAGTSAPLTFGEKGALTGSTGCNQFAGTYVQDGATLKLDPGATTLMACTGDVAAQETAVLAAMPQVVSFTRTQDELTLLDASGATLLVYTPGLAGLEGTSWTAVGINNGKSAVVNSAGTEKVTAAFGEDGSLTGSGGCNTYRATYAVTDRNGLKIGPVLSTKKACADDVNTIEQNYFAALGNVATYVIDGSTLTLRDSDGSIQVTFTLAG